jgi:hypothetical protein
MHARTVCDIELGKNGPRLPTIRRLTVLLSVAQSEVSEFATMTDPCASNDETVGEEGDEA